MTLLNNRTSCKGIIDLSSKLTNDSIQNLVIRAGEEISTQSEIAFCLWENNTQPFSLIIAHASTFYPQSEEALKLRFVA
jgi:hypothetical protein